MMVNLKREMKIHRQCWKLWKIYSYDSDKIVELTDVKADIEFHEQRLLNLVPSTLIEGIFNG